MSGRFHGPSSVDERRRRSASVREPGKPAHGRGPTSRIRSMPLLPPPPPPLTTTAVLAAIDQRGHPPSKGPCKVRITRKRARKKKGGRWSSLPQRSAIGCGATRRCNPAISRVVARLHLQHVCGRILHGMSCTAQYCTMPCFDGQVVSAKQASQNQRGLQLRHPHRRC